MMKTVLSFTTDCNWSVFKPKSCNLERKILASVKVLAFDAWSLVQLTKLRKYSCFLSKQIQKIPGLPLVKILVCYKVIIFPTLLLHVRKGIPVWLVFYSLGIVIFIYYPPQLKMDSKMKQKKTDISMEILKCCQLKQDNDGEFSY